jgi:hypothetical protein
VTRDDNVELRLKLMAQVGMASSLMVDVEPGAQENAQEFLGGYAG